MQDLRLHLVECSRFFFYQIMLFSHSFYCPANMAGQPTNYERLYCIRLFCSKAGGPWSLNRRPHIGVFNFTNGFRLSVNRMPGISGVLRGLKPVNVPQVSAFQKLPLFMKIPLFAGYGMPHTPLLECSRIPPVYRKNRCGFAADTALIGWSVVEPKGRKNGPVNNSGPLFFVFSLLLHCFTHFCGGFPRTA